jgi:hypothetical protein
VEGEEILDVSSDSGDTLSLRLRFFVAVLHLRGTHIQIQPIREERDILCWNGEIFDGLEVTFQDSLSFFCSTTTESSWTTWKMMNNES